MAGKTNTRFTDSRSVSNLADRSGVGGLELKVTRVEQSVFDLGCPAICD
jgi:hypothetical protein